MLHNILHFTDNNDRRGEEGRVMKALQHPANLTQLVHILCNLEQCSSGTRHLAAVLLRKRIFSLWFSLSAAEQLEVRQLLLQQLGREEVRTVRFAVAHIVTRLAKADAENGGGGWPELQQAIRVSAEDPNPSMRELAMVLLYSVSEVFSEENALSDLAAEAVVRGVQDSEETVARAALKAGMALLPCLHEKSALKETFLAHLVPTCIHSLFRLMMMKEKIGLCVAVLDLLEQSIYPISVKKQAPLLQSLLAAVLQVISNSEVPLLVRQNCGALLSKVVELKPKYAVSNGLLPELAKAAFLLMSEDDAIGLPDSDIVPDDVSGEDGDEDEDVDLLHPHPACLIGCQLLNSFSDHVSKKQYTSAVLPFIEESTNGDPNPRQKKAVMLALACLAESNPGYLRRRMTYVLELTARYLQDPHPTPREAASAALSWFCLNLQPEILTHHADLFPMLTPMLQDPSDLVRRRAAQALDTLCEHVAENLEPYVSNIVEIVLASLPTSSLLTQKEMCCVLSSVAAAKTQSFDALAPQVLSLLQEAVQASSPETIPLRARATETVGVVGAAMGADRFRPYLPHFVPHVVENFKTDHPLLREYSFGFFSNLCELLGPEFEPYAADVLACAIKTIEQDTAKYTNRHLLAKAGPEFKFQLEDDKLNGQGGGPSDEDQEDDDDDDDAEEIHMRVRTADVEEKCAAVYAVGVIAEKLRHLIGEAQLQTCWSLLLSLDRHFYPDIRSNALVALAKLAKAAHGFEEVDKTAEGDRLTPFTREFVDHLMHGVLYPCIENESEKDVVRAALESLGIMLNFFGPQCLLFGPDEVIRLCIQLLRVKMPCQLHDADEDSDRSDEEDEDVFEAAEQQQEDGSGSSTWALTMNPQELLQNVRLPEDHDDEVLEEAMDVLETVFDLSSEYAVRYAPFVIPLLLLYVDPQTRPAEDVVSGMGTLACLLNAMKMTSAVMPYFDLGFQAAVCVIEGSDESAARSNAAFMFKVLLERCSERFAADPALLHKTMEILWHTASQGDGGVGEEIPEAVDNAVSATCSLVRCLPPSLVPLEAIMPSLLAKVPMRVDKTENPNALKTLCYFLADPAVNTGTARAPWLPALFDAVLRMLQSRSVEPEEKEKLARDGICVFAQAFPAAWAQAPAELSSLLESWREAQ